MSVAIATLRPRRRLGPALRRARVPFGGLAFSALMHVALAAVILIAGHVWRASQPKTYVVNLVPAVAAIGSPQGRTTQTTAPQNPVPTPAPTLPEREPARPAERPSRATDLPERPPAPRESVALPDRTLPSRTPTLPRPGEKELPRVASAPSPAVPGPSATRAAAPPPPAPHGLPTGSPQGVGAKTLSAADFPFAWYLRQVESKISQRWEGQAQDGTQPQVVFEIGRDGTIRGLAVEKSSNNRVYDQKALRAVTEAAPFPPLPEEFREAFLRIHMGFNYSGTRG